jgi:type IV pilus assembly protein PilQ
VQARTIVPRYESRTIGGESSGPRYTGKAIDLDLKDADIHNVCRLLADVGHVNIVLGDGVQGQVTLVMKRVPWDQALDAVLAAKGLRSERDGNVILVFAK